MHHVLAHYPCPFPLIISFQGLKELGELVASYQGLRDNGARGPSIVSASIACARRCNLDKDIKDLPMDDVDCKQMTLEVMVCVIACLFIRTHCLWKSCRRTVHLRTNPICFLMRVCAKENSTSSDCFQHSLQCLGTCRLRIHSQLTCVASPAFPAYPRPIPPVSTCTVRSRTMIFNVDVSIRLPCLLHDRSNITTGA